MNDLVALRYPIGDFEYGKSYSNAETDRHILTISELPSRFVTLVRDWNDTQLDTPYRLGGWTVRQLVHHVADSHINAYVRTKLALTEDNPTIKPYEEGEWANLPDSQLDVMPSLQLLQQVHWRWVVILKSLTEADLLRTYFHPASQRSFTLRELIAMYDWHSEHHYQHAYRLAQRNGWV